jgi:hypothetical protein
MNLEAQIELITDPQEFTRLCNAVLVAEYGEDFLPIDDDRADGGNDGYRKSTCQVFAVHCFKRIQKQKITDEIRRKMLGDLGKAKTLKQQGLWEVERWTFLSNYPIPEEIGRQAIALGAEGQIEVSWLGPGFVASSLQRRRDVRALFPTLQANEVADQLKGLRIALDGPAPVAPDRVPRTLDEQKAVLSVRPPGWEYLLFGGALYIGKDSLEGKWHDFEIPPHSRFHEISDVSEASSFLSREMKQIIGLTEALERVFSPAVQEQAFGPPGVEGDPHRIEHLANRVISTYEGILDWAAELRQFRFPEVLAPAFEMVPLMADRPLRKFRDFVDNAVAELDRVPGILEEDEPEEPIVLTLDLHLELDPDVMAEYHRRIKRARRKQRWGF